MKIRSITVFCEPGYPVNRLLLQQVGIFATHARKLFEEAGFEVQSLRLATPPFGQFVAPIDLPEAAQSCAIEAMPMGLSTSHLALPGLTPPSGMRSRLPWGAATVFSFWIADDPTR